MNKINYSEDIKEAAWGAWDGLSHSPEQRAEATIMAYNNHLNEARADIEKMATTEPQKQIIEEIFNDHHEGYKKKYIAWLNAKSRCFSSFIVGPANFPVRQMEKRNRSEDNRLNELINYENSLARHAKRRFDALLTSEQKINIADDFQLKKLNKKLVTCVTVLKNPKGNGSPALFKANLSGMIRRSSSKVVILFLEELKKYQIEQNIVVFTPRNSIWSAGTEIEALEIKNVERVAQQIVHSENDFKIVENFQADRIQILFTEKPDEEMRRKLKMRGFRWSPTNSAWQRQLTNNARYATKTVLNISAFKVEEEKREDPYNTFGA